MTRALLACAVAVAGCGRDAAPPAKRTPVAPPAVREQDAASRPARVALPAAAASIEFPSAEALMTHVRALTAASLRGREAGTVGERDAAAYIAARFRALGLAPAGDDGTFLHAFRYPHWAAAPWPAVDETRTSHNVMAWLPGSDATSEDYLIVGAHYDHLGVDADGHVYAGADDNASGVAGLLGIAEAWAARPQRPALSVLFVAFGAEEQGLRGSYALVAAPPRPLARIRFMLNFDMIGSAPFLDGPGMAVVRAGMGVGQGPGVGALTDVDRPAVAGIAHAAADAESFALYADSDFTSDSSNDIVRDLRADAIQRSDHRAFMERGVPYLWLCTGGQRVYHQPTDTPERVDATVLHTVARIGFRIALAADAGAVR